MKRRTGCMKHRILVGSPGVVTGRSVRDPVGPKKGEHLFRDTCLGRRLCDGLKGQVGAFKAKVGGPIQTEFEEDFIFRADA